MGTLPAISRGSVYAEASQLAENVQVADVVPYARVMQCKGLRRTAAVLVLRLVQHSSRPIRDQRGSALPRFETCHFLPLSGYQFVQLRLASGATPGTSGTKGKRRRITL